MIKQMTKYSFVVFHEDTPAFLETLKSLKEESRNEVRLDIEHALEDAGVPIDQFEAAMRVVAAA